MNSRLWLTFAFVALYAVIKLVSLGVAYGVEHASVSEVLPVIWRPQDDALVVICLLASANWSWLLRKTGER
jgi:exonuclease I